MVIDGRAIAQGILSGVKERVERLGRTPAVRAVVLEPTPSTKSYLRIKAAKAAEAGMELQVVELPHASRTEEVVLAACDPAPDATIVQLPLPAHIARQQVLDAIPLTKDADVLSASAYERFLAGDPTAPLPPVVCAVSELLGRTGPLHGKSLAVIGAGRLVGQPVAAWLAGNGMLVRTLTEETFDESLDFLKSADVVVAGAGVPHLIQPGMLKKDVICIDAGTSELGGSIAGDFDPSCADVASVFTPVPGGVGPIAVACLFRNVATLLESTAG